MADAQRPAAVGTTRTIAIAAILIALGNIASRIFGLVREATIAYFFGRGLPVEAFAAAWTIPTLLYDLLINGAISAALIPVFSELADGDDKTFWDTVSRVVNVVLLVLATMVVVLAWQAPTLVDLLIEDGRPELHALTVDLVRPMLPAVVFMGLAGLMTAVLYARQRFLLPAFAPTVFNIGIIVAAVFLHEQIGVQSLALGILFGAVAQVLLQVPALRDARYRPLFNPRHPSVARILLLYAPVALGIGFSTIGVLVDRQWASGFSSALDTMRYATTLIQFPLGLVAAAVSLAVLPTLSRQDANEDRAAFRQTLGMGIKVVLLLVLPATAGLAALALPVTGLLFERGAFGAADTTITAVALLFYLPSLPAAAIDQLLIFAFYARKKTLTPNLVQGAAVATYLAVAGSLLFFFRDELGFFALIIGNAAQWIAHALLMYVLLQREISLRGVRLGEATLKSLLASGAMALVIVGLVQWVLPAVLPASLVSPFVLIVLAGIPGAVLYFGVCVVLRVEAFDYFVRAVRRKLGR